METENHRSAKGPSHGTPSFRQSTSGSNTPREATIQTEDDELVRAHEPARKQLLQNFAQGVLDHDPAEHNFPSKSEIVTSHFWPDARINESTDDIIEKIASGEQANSNRNNPQAFQHATHSADHDPDSVDELAMDSPRGSSAPSKRQVSPSKTPKNSNSGKSQGVNYKTTQGWPLLLARTHDFDSRQFPKSTDIAGPHIFLKPWEEQAWRVIVKEGTSGTFESKAFIKPKDVTKVMADDDGRIRLEGPRGLDGNHPIFDLEFEDIKGFREYRDVHASRLSGRGKFTQKPEAAMKMLFSKPLPKNIKVGTTPLVHDLPVVDDQEQTANLNQRSPLWTQMRDSRQALNPITSHLGNEEKVPASAPRGASGRAVRSTRASAPKHDANDEDSSREVEKFSVREGLGKPWLKPLTYGEGRQKATVYFEDLWRLDEEELMNDSLIDFYMIYLFKQSGIPQEKVFFFNTYFFTRLTQNTARGSSINYQAVERWTSKVDVFSYDYIVVPINEDTHWYLAVICNVGNIDRKALQEDFDNDAVDHAANLAVVEAPVEPQLVEGPTPATSRPSSVGKCEDDVNLFDEESKLDLVNREDTGIEGEDRQAAASASSVPQSPQSEAAHAVRSIFDDPVPSKTVLSNLQASPEKKKLKRRPTAPKKDPTQPVIIILDSLSQRRSPTVRALKDWLMAEGNERRGMEATIKENGFYPKSSQIPTQNNFTDCGVYLLGYAEKFFKNPDEFKNKLLTGEMTADEDWPQLKPKDMRNNLRDIIFGLAKEQRLTEATRKKVKKSIQASTSSPAKSENPLPQMAAEVVKSVETEPAATEALPVAPELATSKETRPSEPSLRRLQSPFSPKFKVDKPLYPPIASTGPVKDSNVALSPPEKAMITSPHPQTPGRRTHPEVRIPVKTPPSEQSIMKQQVRSENPQKGSPQNIRVNARSASPLKRVREAKDDDELPQPPRKRSTPDLVSKEPKYPSRLSPLLERRQEGHSDHPIEIKDSQESKPTATQPSRRVLLRSPVRLKQSSRSPRKTPALPHEPSVEEISAFSMRRRRIRQAEETFVGSQLEARLDADDEGREKSKQARTSVTLGGSEPDLMDIDSQGADPMDIADDTVVRETPEPRRRSPAADATWVTGNPLPL
jgi:sentrin-specific protease 7